MGMKNGRWVSEVVTVTTRDLDFIEEHCSDVYPYSVWVDVDNLEGYPEIEEWLKDGYEKELEMLKNNEIDYILIEYDM